MQAVVVVSHKQPLMKAQVPPASVNLFCFYEVG